MIKDSDKEHALLRIGKSRGRFYQEMQETLEQLTHSVRLYLWDNGIPFQREEYNMLRALARQELADNGPSESGCLRLSGVSKGLAATVLAREELFLRLIRMGLLVPTQPQYIEKLLAYALQGTSDGDLYLPVRLSALAQQIAFKPYEANCFAAEADVEDD